MTQVYEVINTSEPEGYGVRIMDYGEKFSLTEGKNQRKLIPNLSSLIRHPQVSEAAAPLQKLENVND